MAGDGNGVSDIFLHERAGGTTTRVAWSDTGPSRNPALDACAADLVYDQRGPDGRRQVLAESHPAPRRRRWAEPVAQLTTSATCWTATTRR